VRLTRCGGESVANRAIAIHFRFVNPSLKMSERCCRSGSRDVGQCRRSQCQIQGGVSAEAELETDTNTGSCGGIEVTTDRVSKARPIIVCRGVPLENTAGAGGVGSRDIET
jgi:hypothetical protein